MKKKMSVLGSALLIIAVTLAILSFRSTTAREEKKPVVVRTYYYYSGNCNQRLLPGVVGLPCCKKSINATWFTNPESWSPWEVSFTPSVAMTDYIGSISFDEDFFTDGPNDGQLTLQEALDAVWAKYILDGQMPSGMTVGTSNITITAATDCH